MNNPHDPISPEWQLWENWKSQACLVRAANEDMKRAEKRKADACHKEKLYAEALEKLGHPVG